MNNSIGKGGSLWTPPQPRENVIVQALSLLSAFGSADESLQKLLEEMRDCQAHNQQLIDDARIVLEKAEVALQREADLVKREARLEARESEFNRILGATKEVFNA